MIRCRPGRSGPRRLEATQEILFVESGSGTLHVGDETHPLEPDTGVYVVSGEEYELDSSGPDDLVVVVVEAPQEDGKANTPVRRTVRFADSRRSRRAPTGSSVTSSTRMSAAATSHSSSG